MNNNRRTLDVALIVLAILAIALAARAQGNTVRLEPGQSIEVICAQPATATPEPPTAIPASPTPTPEPPTPPQSAVLCGLFHAYAADAPVIDQVGASIAHLIVRPAQGPDSWRRQIGALFDGGAMVIVEMYPRPWSWNGSSWTFNQYADPFLDLVTELHAAGPVLAVFGPVDEPYAHGYTTAQLQALYTEIKTRAPGVPVYSTFGSLHYWEDHDPARVIAPGVVDYASPHYYPFDSSGYRRDTYISELEAEIEILNRLAPDTHLIWLVQAFALPTHPRGLRMPTADELLDASAIAFDHQVPILYYTYNRVASSYTDYLALHPELFDAVCRQND